MFVNIPTPFRGRLEEARNEFHVEPIIYWQRLEATNLKILKGLLMKLNLV